MTNDISRILARSRKRGFHVILAHQWLEQLREKGDSIYHGVMGIQNKVIFGGLSDEDAVIMADQLFRNEYDLEVPIQSLTKPGVAGYRRIWLNNWSTSEGIVDTEMHSESISEAESSSSGLGASESISQIYDSDGFPEGKYTVSSGGSTATVDSRGVTTSSGYGRTTGSTSTSSQGTSEALMPILKNFIGGVHSLDNVRHMAISRLRSIPPRNAVVKGFNTPTFDITTFTIEEPIVAQVNVEKFKQRVFSSSPYTLPTKEVRQLVQQKQSELLDLAKYFEPSHVPHPLGDDDNEPLG